MVSFSNSFGFALLFCLGAAIPLLAFDPDAPVPPPPTAPGATVFFPSGKRVLGVQDAHHVTGWLGLRYATGERFNSSIAYPIENLPSFANEFGDVCPQVLKASYGFPPGTRISEDCLFLNVFAPKGAHNLPVYVFIHGGSLVLGSGSEDVYWGYQLANQHNIVVVTINYRLGAFGFFGSSSLSASKENGAWGFGDQQRALGWVKRHISVFGGDDGQITIGGESAGGSSTTFHLLAPGSSSFFSQAIVESGAPLFETCSPAQAQVQADELLQALGCTAGDVACARAKSMEDVLHAQQANVIAISRVMVNPLGLLPVSPLKALMGGSAAGLQAKPLLAGNTRTEGTLFVYPLFPHPVPPSNYTSAVELVMHNLNFTAIGTNEILKLYPCDQPDCRYQLSMLYGDGLLQCPTSLLLRGMSKSHSSVWAYLFDYVASWMPPHLLVPHASELPFVFDTLAYPLREYFNATQSDLAMAKRMSSRWASYVATSTPRWPTYNETTQARWNFSMPSSSLTHAYDEEICQKWFGFYKRIYQM